ncbi:hypothetical protein CRUP_012227 [Coryphaenoides rupestris]|nr:hypothetical protein CRUP_012227 [Coryphaenoides rupestris]
MQRAFSFPLTVERSRTKERVEASLAGLCELELRKQRQECLVLGALALSGDPAVAQQHSSHSTGADVACFSNWGQENLTLRRQLLYARTAWRSWSRLEELEPPGGAFARIKLSSVGFKLAPSHEELGHGDGAVSPASLARMWLRGWRGEETARTKGGGPHIYEGVMRRPAAPDPEHSALQNSPWGLMQALEKQVGELRIDLTNESYEAALGDAGDSRPSSGSPRCSGPLWD